MKADDSHSRSRALFLAEIALVLCGSLFGLLVAEGLLHLFRPQVFEVHPPGMYVPDQDVGYSLTPGFSGFISRSEFRAYFTVGQSGLRGSGPSTRIKD